MKFTSYNQKIGMKVGSKLTAETKQKLQCLHTRYTPPDTLNIQK